MALQRYVDIISRSVLDKDDRANLMPLSNEREAPHCVAELVNWLWGNLTHTQTVFRRQCMSVFLTIAPLLALEQVDYQEGYFKPSLLDHTDDQHVSATDGRRARSLVVWYVCTYQQSTGNDNALPHPKKPRAAPGVSASQSAASDDHTDVRTRFAAAIDAIMLPVLNTAGCLRHTQPDSGHVGEVGLTDGGQFLALLQWLRSFNALLDFFNWAITQV